MLNKNYKTKNKDIEVLLRIFDKVQGLSQLVFYQCKNAQENKNLISEFLQQKQICDIFSFFSCSKGDITKVLNQNLINESINKTQVVIIENLQEISYEDYVSYLNFLKIISKQKYQILIINTYCHNRKSNFGLFLLKNLLETFCMEISLFGDFDYKCDMHSYKKNNQLNAVNFEHKELLLMGKFHKIIPEVWDTIADCMICLDYDQMLFAVEIYLAYLKYFVDISFWKRQENRFANYDFFAVKFSYSWVKNFDTKDLKHISYMVSRLDEDKFNDLFPEQTRDERILELLDYLEKEESYYNCIRLCDKFHFYTKNEIYKQKELYYLKKCNCDFLLALYYYFVSFTYIKEDDERNQVCAKQVKYAKKINSWYLLNKAYYGIAFSSEDTNERLEYFDKAMQAVIYSNDYTDFENILYDCIDCFVEFELYDKAVEYIQKYQDYFFLINEIDLYYICFEALGSLCFKKKDIQSALKYYNIALNYFKKQNNTKGISDVYDIIAGKFYEDFQDYKTAIYYYRLALKNNVVLPAQKNCLIADCYNQLNNSKLAIKYYEKAFEIAIDVNTITFIPKLVNLYLEQKQIKKAGSWIEKFRKSRISYKQTCKCYIDESQGDILALDNKIDEALKYYKKALKDYNKFDYSYQASRVYGKIAEMYYIAGNYQKALDWDDQSNIRYIKECSLVYRYYIRKLKCLISLEKYQDAVIFFWAEIRESGFRDDDFDSYMRLFELCMLSLRKLGKLDAAEILISQVYDYASKTNGNYGILLCSMVALNHYIETGQWILAQDFFENQVEIFAKKDDWLALYRIYLSFGTIILENEDSNQEINYKQYKYYWEYAIYLLEQGLIIGRNCKEEDHTDRISFLMILGECKQKYLKGENGLQEYLECVEISQRENEYNYWVNCKVRIVEIRNNTNPDYQKNIEDLIPLLDLKKHLDIVNYYELTAFLADSYYKLNQKEEARPFIEALFKSNHYSKFFDQGEINLYKKEYGV